MNTMVTEITKPWYRYPLVWMLIAIPASAVAVCSVIIWFAVTTNDGLVVDDYYRQGLAINQVLERDQYAAANKLSAKLNVLESERLVMLDFNKGLLAEYPETLELNFRHATRGDSDVALTLLHGQGSQYISYLQHSLPTGFWYIEVGNKDWRLNARSRLEDMPNIELNSTGTTNRPPLD
jgi:hypothetical protein